MSDWFRRISKPTMAVIDRMSIPILAVWMCCFILLFALAYWLLGFRGQGLATASSAWVPFPDCAYFSVVTFTSLGYGDIVPHGTSKIFACLEVVVGLAFLGVFIAKLSSSKQSFHLAQLYARDVQERLEDFSETLRGLSGECTSALDTLKRDQILPRGMSKIVSEANGTTRRIRSYLGFEIANGELLIETPTGSQARLVRRFTQFVVALADLVCYPKSLHSQRARRVTKETIELCRQIGDLIDKGTEDAAVKSDNNKLLSKCKISLEKIEEIEEIVADMYK